MLSTIGVTEAVPPHDMHIQNNNNNKGLDLCLSCKMEIPHTCNTWNSPWGRSFFTEASPYASKYGGFLINSTIPAHRKHIATRKWITCSTSKKASLHVLRLERRKDAKIGGISKSLRWNFLLYDIYTRLAQYYATKLLLRKLETKEEAWRVTN